MKKIIICGPENVKEFRGMLKETVPEFFDLVKVLYEGGLIEGLRGCKLEIGVIGREKNKNPVVAKKTAFTCKDCANWVKDSLGDFTAAGTCLVNALPKVLKWPNTLACEEHEV